MDELDGADVDAARGLADEQDARVAAELAAEDQLLLVAAREFRGCEQLVARAHVVLVHHGPAAGARDASAQERPGVHVGIVLVAEQRRFPGREAEHEPEPMPVLGHVGHAERAHAARAHGVRRTGRHHSSCKNTKLKTMAPQ